MRLKGLSNIKSLDFDISKRELDVFHTGTSDEILTALQNLNLDTTHVRSIESELQIPKTGDDRKLLWIIFLQKSTFCFGFGQRISADQENRLRHYVNGR